MKEIKYSKNYMTNSQITESFLPRESNYWKIPMRILQPYFIIWMAPKNLYQWLQLLKDSDEDFKNQDQQASTLLIPYLYKRLSMRNINRYDGLNIDQKSKLFSGDYDVIFNDLEFENLYEGKLFWNRTLLNHYKNLDSLAAEIMNQSKSS